MEQLSLDYYIKQEAISLVPARTAFIDESGSYGFSFEKEGTQRYYVICAVVVHSSELDEVEKSFDDICRNNGYPDSEMKSSGIGKNDRRRQKIFSEILPLNFSIILLIADKEAFYANSPLVEFKESFVKYLHQRLYETMYAAYPKLLIAEDTFGTTDFQNGYHKYVEEHRHSRNLFNEYDFTFVDSSSTRLIQLADFIAGSIAQQYEESSKSSYLQILRGKTTCCTHFPNLEGPYFANPAQKSESFDKPIFELAAHTAQSFIDDNSKSEEYETRLKLATLRHLLFTVNDIDARKYVPAKELTKMLFEYSGSKISSNYFYRKIIASLRDEGVILASCTKGYKIPISYHDIIDYVNSTAGIVGPMLTRLGRCRSLIQRYTDSNIDILNDQAFLGYKKYFD